MRGRVPTQSVKQERLTGLRGLGVGEHRRGRDLLGLPQRRRPGFFRQRLHPAANRGGRWLRVVEPGHVGGQRIGEPSVQRLLRDDLPGVETGELGLRSLLRVGPQHEVVRARDVA